MSLWNAWSRGAVAVRAGMVGLLAAAGLATQAPPAAAGPAEAAKPPLTISILTSSRTDRCFDAGDIAVVGPGGGG